MKLLVTGAAGFIGSHFVDQILTGPNSEHFEKVTVLDCLTYAGNLANLNQVKDDPKFRFLRGDIRSSDLMATLVKDHDLVINFAAESHVDRSLENANDFVESNYVGVFNILNAIKKWENKKLVQISTDEVYGHIDSGSWDENFPLNPRSPYSATKAAADLLVLSFVNSYGVNACITRGSNNFGPRQFPEKLIPNTILKSLNGERVPVYGDGKNIRDWLFVLDHVQGIEKVMFEGKSGNVYNLGGDQEYTNLQVVSLILRILKVDLEAIQFVSDRPGHDFRYSLDSNKAKSSIGYSPSQNFYSRLEETIEWYLQNENWWRPLLSKKDS